MASLATRQLMKKIAIERGRQRSAHVSERVRSTMKLIEEEIMSNLGIYPHNNGTVSAAELARRTGIHPTTLHSPNQHELYIDVKGWIEKLNLRDAPREEPTRLNLRQRVANWKQLYDRLAQSHRDTELELQEAQAEILKLRQDFDMLQHEYTRLREISKAFADQKILQLPRRSKGDAEPTK